MNLRSAKPEERGKALAEKYILSEEYEDMVINLLRSSNIGLEDKAEQKELIRYILNVNITPTVVDIILERQSNTIFECFAYDIGNFGGKDNYYTFILEMAKLFNSAYSSELNAVENSDNYRKSVCSCIFNWSKQGKMNLIATQGTILTNNLSNHGYYYNACHSSVGSSLNPGQIILVNFQRDFDFLKATENRMTAMPAFVLKYIIDYEVKAQNINFVDNLMTFFAFAKAIKGLAFISDASKLDKLKIGWDILKATLGIVLENEEIRQQISSKGKAGEDFIEYWDKFQELDAWAGGVGGIKKVFNNETFWMFTEMTTAWDVIKQDPNLNIDKDKITKEINDLKTLFSDEGIVY